METRFILITKELISLILVDLFDWPHICKMVHLILQLHCIYKMVHMIMQLHSIIKPGKTPKYSCKILMFWLTMSLQNSSKYLSYKVISFQHQTFLISSPRSLDGNVVFAFFSSTSKSKSLIIINKINLMKVNEN